MLHLMRLRRRGLECVASTVIIQQMADERAEDPHETHSVRCRPSTICNRLLPSSLRYADEPITKLRAARPRIYIDSARHDNPHPRFHRHWSTTNNAPGPAERRPTAPRRLPQAATLSQTTWRLTTRHRNERHDDSGPVPFERSSPALVDSILPSNRKRKWVSTLKQEKRRKG